MVITPHIGGATHETLLQGAEMIAAEIKRFCAGEPIVNVVNRTRGGMSDELLLAIDAGTGSCRAVVFAADGTQVAIGQREYSHPEVPGVPGSQVFDTDANWRLICDCIAEVLAAEGVRPRRSGRVSATSMREGMVLYDARGREIWACPNVDARAGEEADRTRSLRRRAGDL